MSSEEIQPEKWKFFDLEREPDKDFWYEIERKSKLRHNTHLPNSFEKVIESDRYDVEPLYSAETIQRGKEEAIKYVREKANRHWSKEKILDEVERKFEEVFSSDD